MSRTVELLLLLVLAGILLADAANVTDAQSCGGVEVPYPFGIINDDGSGNFREKGFDVTCEAGKLAFYGYKIGNFSIKTAEVTLWQPVTWRCHDSSGNLNGSYSGHLYFNNKNVYRVSSAGNYVYALGCNTLGYLWSALSDDNIYNHNQLMGCTGYCSNHLSAVNGVCHGVGCCEADIPLGLVDYNVYFRYIFEGFIANSTKFSPCDYVFMAERGYYTFDTDDLNMDLHQTPRFMPVRLDWAIRDSPTCKEAKNTVKYACISSNSICLDSTNGPGYICNCTDGYQGNPYVENGCTGAALGIVIFVFIIVIIIFFLILAKEKRKMKELFQKNGGPTLEKLNNIKLFTKEDIKKIRKVGKYIGKGAFGSVYSGHIEDSDQAVAVKAPINGTSADKSQFVNEIIIQSQVIHRNIVKLVGCCLEVDVPILVYEFVPNGSLDDILHGVRKLPLNMGCRLKIAAESTEGLAYMHSKAHTTILHGDVKPANILLNDEFLPKISDFGISRLIATDLQKTIHVIGDMSYMDPIFMQTGNLTKKE